MFKMGVVTKALVNKYWFDQIGYRYIVVPVRDQLAKAAYWSNQEVLDAMVKGAGGAAKRIADVTYDTIDQRIIDGGVNGAAFSAAWWSDKLKRIQAGNVQRYAGALVAGVIVLVLVFAASS
jgi:NADH-quinone oxidoreductase subunit L